MNIELIHDASAELGESPIWDHRTGTLFWIDVLKKRIHAHHEASGTNRFYPLDVTPGCIAPREDGNLMIAYDNSFGIFDLKTQEIREIDTPEKNMAENRFNDGKCDPEGRFWFGSMCRNEDSASGALYCVHSDYSYQKLLNGVTTSNGLAWSGDRFYYIDTMKFSVEVFDYEKTSGTISNNRCLIDFTKEQGRPDGMTIDQKGTLWIGHWDGGILSQWSTETGKCLARVEIPAWNITSCAFGGEKKNTLFITTAAVCTPESKIKNYPFRGGLFAIKNIGRGQETPLFKDSTQENRF